MKLSTLISTYRFIKPVLPLAYKNSPIKLVALSVIKAVLDVFGIALVLPIMFMILQQTPNRYLPNVISAQSLPMVCAEILVLLGVKTGLTYLISRIQMDIISGIIRDVSVNKLSDFLKNDYITQKRQHTAEQVNIVTNIPFDFATNILIPYINLVTETVVLSIIVLSLCIYKPVLCLLSLCILAPFIISYRLSMRKRLANFNNTHQEASRQYHFMASEILRAYVDIKITHTQAYFKNKFEQAASNVVKPYAAFNVTNDMVSKITELVAVGGLCVIVLVSVWYKYSHTFLLEFLSVFILGLSRLLPSINRILFYVNNIKSSQFAIDNLMPADKDAQDDIILKREASLQFKDQIKIQGVYYKYEEKDVLTGVDLVINKGDIIGLKGASGSGKSSLVYTLLGLITPEKGNISVDGVTITESNADAWRAMIGYVPQHVSMLDGTVADNIAFGNKQDAIDKNRLTLSLVQSGADTFVALLPNGLQTRLGENGFSLSGGQRQRIAIARALYRQPNILILDEGTNALDTESEEGLLGAINGIDKPHTIVIIAHRSSAFRLCNRMYELSEGKLKEQTIG